MFAKKIIIVIFGIIIPIILMACATIGLVSTKNFVEKSETPQTIARVVADLNSMKLDERAYSLYALMYAESINYKTMVNKQSIKIVGMQIGFVLISVGIMTILLKIKAEPFSVGGNIYDIIIDVKSTSPGILLFVLGAAMVSASVLLKNQYATVPIPALLSGEGLSTEKYLIQWYVDCSGNASSRDGDVSKCFADKFRQNYGGVLR